MGVGMRVLSLLLLGTTSVSASFVQQRCFPFERWEDRGYYYGYTSRQSRDLRVTVKQNTSLLVYPLSAIHNTTIPRVIDNTALNSSESGFFLCTDELIEKDMCGVEERGKFQYQCTTEGNNCPSDVSQYIIDVEDGPKAISYSVNNAGVYCVVAVQSVDTTADAIAIEERHSMYGDSLSVNEPLVLFEVAEYYYWIGFFAMVLFMAGVFRCLAKDLWFVVETSPEKGAPVDLTFRAWLLPTGLYCLVHSVTFMFCSTTTEDPKFGIFLDPVMSCIWLIVGYFLCFAHDGYSESLLMIPLSGCWWALYALYCITLTFRGSVISHFTGSMTYQTFQSVDKACVALISLCWVCTWSINCYMIWSRVQKLSLTGDEKFRRKYDKTFLMAVWVFLGFPLLTFLAQMTLQVPLWYNGGGFYFFAKGVSLWQLFFPDEGPFERPTTQNFVFQFFKHITRHQFVAFVIGICAIWPEFDHDASYEAFMREYEAEQQRRRGHVCPSCSTRVQCSSHQTLV